jgi:deoxycytidylate deaminase/dephospho-CoA kinase
MTNPLVIGLAGPFGSGCTTTAGILSEREGFTVLRLSDVIKAEWKRRYEGKIPQRSDLQALGNQMRAEAANAGLLAEIGVGGIGDIRPDARIVVDGIRNVGEIEYLSDRFGAGFFVFALECPTSERWTRLNHIYQKSGLDLEAFCKDDERDHDQEYKYGQQVQLCVDRADVLINNTDTSGIAALRDKLLAYLDLITGRRPRYATPSEIFMNLAYSAAHGSKCLKRQVGAVIVSAPAGEIGDIVGQGFNENPAPTKPCVEERQYGAINGERGRCYRDIVRQDSFKSFVTLGLKCPICSAALTEPSPGVPLWKCTKCEQDFEKYFWPERAMTLCTAIHAEVAALYAAGRRSRGSTLYTTTFPCFQCTEKIILAGVRCIVFNEPYPDVRAGGRLILAGIETVRFEGIRSRRFDEIFARARR